LTCRPGEIRIFRISPAPDPRYSTPLRTGRSASVVAVFGRIASHARTDARSRSKQKGRTAAMFVVLLKFADKSKAGPLMDGHKEWIRRGFDDGVFLLVGSLQPNQGGGIVAHNTTLADL
jgi:hypothetical protein